MSDEQKGESSVRDIRRFTQDDWQTASDEELLLGYQAMAADKEREIEANEWSEALIGDGRDIGRKAMP
jgi:hypothetical protein